jgi:uncharacterized protein YegL
MEQGRIGASNFKFSGIRTEHLGASEYTLFTIGIDYTGSVRSFKTELRKCLITSIESCKKSPRADNILVRVFLFSEEFPSGIQEIHGFKPLAEIDPNDYPDLQPGGGTPLFDAVYSAIGATNAYAQKLHDDDFMTNAITTIITDGDDNASTMKPSAIKREVERAIKGEFIESSLTILVGVNVAMYLPELQAFQKDAALDKFIDAGDVTPGKLAKLAEFVSKSVSSQSQALGSGGPSQNIDATI